MKIEFYSTIQGVLETFPIENARDCLPTWMGLARQEYLTNKQQISVYRCPGIVDLLGAGFVLRSWFDIEISTDEHNRLSACTPSADLESMLGCPPLQIQGGDEIAKFLPKRPWSHPDLLKINTPWHVVAPKGVKLMMLPMSYTDEFAFDSSIGILDPSISSEINIQGYVNRTGTIKAGTPLVHIIPMTEHSYDLVVREMNDKDRSWVSKKKYLSAFSFVFNRKRTKEAYHNHYGTKCPFHFGK